MWISMRKSHPAIGQECLLAICIGVDGEGDDIYDYYVGVVENDGGHIYMGCQTSQWYSMNDVDFWQPLEAITGEENETI